MDITHASPVGEIAAAVPAATRVFHRHQIDFCCGGGRPLEEVCDRKGLSVDSILDEIETEVTPADTSARDWTDAPLGDLIDHILTTYHEPLREELPRLQSMAHKVLRVHGDSDPEMLATLNDVLDGLVAELYSHMLKEERILFPMIKHGGGSSAGAPISVMEHEHDSAGDALRRMRELTRDYDPPEWACTTYRALFGGLADLEEALHEHIHLENNILFPRALAG
ncbi:MAG: iron-sulfur cluster repair di-iron protein [Rhodothermia bacterium]